MNETDTSHGVGHEIGTDAATRTEEHAAEYCARERQRIELTNQPAILALRGKIGVLKDMADDIEARIPKAAPPGEARPRKRKALLFWSVAALLSIAGFVFVVIAFEPFRLGWKAWLYCAGIAVVTPFLVDQVLDSWPNVNLVRVLRTVACMAAILSGILLAVIRGDLLTQEITQDNPVVTVNADDPSTTPASPASAPTAPPATEENFYDRTLGLLRLAMALLAFTMELGAGLAVHEARRWSSSGEDSETLQNKLKGVRDEMIERGHNLWLLENEGAIFENCFWRDFYRSLLTKTVTGAMRKLPVIIMALVCLAHGRLHAADRLDVVIFPDLSRSVAAKDQSDRAEFQKNIDGVTRVLASLPAGSRVSIYGITDNSFAKPYPLLTAELSDELRSTAVLKLVANTADAAAFLFRSSSYNFHKLERLLEGVLIGVTVDTELDHPGRLRIDTDISGIGSREFTRGLQVADVQTVEHEMAVGKAFESGSAIDKAHEAQDSPRGAAPFGSIIWCESEAIGPSIAYAHTALHVAEHISTVKSGRSKPKGDCSMEILDLFSGSGYCARCLANRNVAWLVYCV